METINKLIHIDEAKDLISQGKNLIIAGNEDLMAKLPKGSWVGGTIPYFMDIDGGCMDKSKLFVTDLSDISKNIKISTYNPDQVARIPGDRYANGFSYILIPGFSEMLTQYAMKINSAPDLYDAPLLGWVTGIDLSEVGKSTPKVICGPDQSFSDNKAVVMHIEMSAEAITAIEIINMFTQGDGDTIMFESDGFSFTDCLINGDKQNLAGYIKSNNIDIKLPLVANYSGAMINSSFQQVNEEEKTVLFYAPLRKGVEYKLAKPVDDYITAFQKKVPDDIEVVSSCNCILNYLYSELEGKKTGLMRGPFTFGEIAYVLVNQTLVYLKIV